MIDLLHRHFSLSNDQRRHAYMALSLGTMRLTHLFTLFEEAKPVVLPMAAGGATAPFPTQPQGPTARGRSPSVNDIDLDEQTNVHSRARASSVPERKRVGDMFGVVRAQPLFQAVGEMLEPIQNAVSETERLWRRGGGI